VQERRLVCLRKYDGRKLQRQRPTSVQHAIANDPALIPGRAASWVRAIEARYSTRARARRAALLTKHIKLRPDDIVLDLGGGAGDHFHSVFPDHKRVVVADILEDHLNLARQRYGYDTMQLRDEDVTLPFSDKQFDVVFCSSVIQEVTGPKCRIDRTMNDADFDQAARLHQWVFAGEIRRIAKRYYVQTPYKYFIIEPHSWLPGIIVFLPRHMLVRLLRFTNTTFWPTRSHPVWRLLTIGEFSKMFPDATIEREWSFGFVKSLMAIKA
jgi:hypothetical protein